jgi:cysteine sulfinate desulfinase/cysteine desulfurase-like protein
MNRSSMSKQIQNPGLYANIHAKKKRIAAGSKEKMRKPGTKGAPTAAAFRKSAKTAKKK